VALVFKSHSNGGKEGGRKVVPLRVSVPPSVLTVIYCPPGRPLRQALVTGSEGDVVCIGELMLGSDRVVTPGRHIHTI
jgi:hypothetical protein